MHNENMISHNQTGLQQSDIQSYVAIKETNK